MGLANDATSHYGKVTTNSATRAAAKLQAEGAARVEKFTEQIHSFMPDVTVVFLDVLTGQHPERHARQYGGHYLSHPAHEVTRFRVDDVVLWAIANNGSTPFEFGAEVPCGRCRHKTGLPPEDNYGWEIVIDPTDYRVKNDPSKMLPRFKNTVGKALASETTLCWNCRAEVGSRCPSCSRPLTTGTDFSRL